MLTLPEQIIPILAAFAPLFSRRVFRHVPVSVVGALLTPGGRTVTAALRAMGRSDCEQFQTYHRVLNRANWSSRKVAQVLLGLLVQAFAPTGPLVIGLDETLERRRGKKIAAKGIYRDPVRSSKSFFVKASGLRWVVMALLVPVPWAARVWALPFLSVLAPSERYHQERGQRHKTLTDWAAGMIAQVRRWCPDRALVIVADSSYACLGLLDRCRKLSAVRVTRLRLDAALYAPAPPRVPGQNGRPRKRGERLPKLSERLPKLSERLPKLSERLSDPATVWERVTVPRWYGRTERTVEVATGTAVWSNAGQPTVPIRWVLIRDPEETFEPQALLCTDEEATAGQIVSWFVLRWQVEVTFHEVREHLGVETQRQWNDLAIQRTTPALLGLFSLVALWAKSWANGGEIPVRQAAWYRKEHATFSDTLAFVWGKLWEQPHEPHEGFVTSPRQPDLTKLQQALLDRLTETLAYAA